MSTSLLHKIVHEMDDMKSAERRVAEFVSAKPDKVIHMSIASLASECSVSDPTIMRFCRRFGYDGYQSFKLNLAQQLVPSAPFVYEQITAKDSVDHIVRKTCRNSLNAIQRAMEDIAPEQIEEGAKLLSKASYIGIYASGISEVTALDAEHKFQRLGLRCNALVRKQRQWLHAERSKPQEVAFIFSQSGATRQLVEIATAARAGGARVVSVTASDSPLAAVSDVTIAITPYERTELLTPLASRLNHHLVVNMLVTAIAVTSGSEFPDQLPALDSWQTEKL
ncbi:DNA-binding transcriptional regulator HexR [Vibrio nigripulchritudo ATCC 27043]|uniref:MurR/RpiR family transcriptional regulator n=1 Tax=Vibrio nigripulchritudo TaxID=28173 RepID=UPI00021C2A29|nr:MurR/RpiR family transcriptional regulator [Vibrio nigripulchritudo]EGU58786.1 DNA-binding transcriptional regulator HexR [Vibrio nigripulchritudo ATCC 27043]CCN34551.1 putative Phosphogluconate repressor HexR, RpiR family [Vibrio nigripulchritudo AM115]CCN42173.1 putative Phosphogluconate repressor HexR, RpiR family [Vibrio nigripulchritudo FTn2]CCN62718.1 putative Phosphogluconate repressor HexR, RpiR family [Vibrio nigripulchritudo POn4]CCN75552.1 putative Phosphogluconate repressor HexR